MPREFKYDVIKLLEGVRDRPCLWDKSLEIYKDRMERRTAWEEVFIILDDKYDEMSPEEKRITGELVLNKWTNIRDTFVKSLKTKMGKPRKKYLLYDHLKFLTKNIPEEECTDYTQIEESVSYLKFEEESAGESSSIREYNTRKRSRKAEYESPPPAKKSIEYEANDLDFIEVSQANDPRIMNEDEAFFASLLPSIVKYTEEERLEFRIEVLAVMRRIQEKRKWASNV